MVEELWSIALVRFESTRGVCLGSCNELFEIVHVIKGRTFQQLETAAHTIVRWETMNPRGLPVPPSALPEVLPNGRYQYYAWVAVPMDSKGIPGFIVPGEDGVFRKLERPFIQQVDDPRCFDVIPTRWPENQVKWFDQAKWFLSAQQGQPQLSTESTNERYSARDYVLDQKHMVKVLTESIDMGCVVLYQSDSDKSTHMGQVLERSLQEFDYERTQVEWKVIRLNDELDPVHLESGEPLIETVVPKLLVRVAWVPFSSGHRGEGVLLT